MSERPESERTLPKGSFTPALLHLLGEAGVQQRSSDRFYVAQLLHKLCCDPNRDHIDKLDTAAQILGTETLEVVIDVTDEPIYQQAPMREAFLADLRDIIEDIRSSDLTLKATAVRFAYTIQEWELASAVDTIQPPESQLSDEEERRWRRLLREKDNFNALLQFEESNRLKKEVFSSGTPSKREERPVINEATLFSSFIDTLDLDDFTGKRDAELGAIRSFINTLDLDDFPDRE